ncbi:MAG: GMC family oxidoreductase [Gaiellaceae bacterium]
MNRGFDYVVVGAGSAGCALARRLSDDPEVTVGLIEAGGPAHRTEITSPSEYFTLWGTDVDWGYETVAQAGTKGRIHGMPRGKVLGGTSSINGMVYLRGAREDFEGWSQLGCVGWDWASVERAYIEMEAVLAPDFLGDRNPLSEVLLAAAEQAGLPHNPSFDSGSLAGSGWNRSTIKDGRRNNSFQAFLAPVSGRSNLTVLSETVALRLLVDPKGTVSGVETSPATGGASARIEAGEVVLCAGAFDSPRLLMLSGIGPADHLRSMGIAAIVDLSVGLNLIDHLLIGVVYDSKQPISLAHSMVTEACAFAWSSCPRSEVPDVEISFAKEANFAPPANDDRYRYTIIPGITQPRSRGSVTLQSGNCADPAIIDPRYLAHPEDLRMLIDGIHLARQIGSAEALTDWNDGEFFPGAAVASDEAISDYITESVSTWFHPVGTCRMGVREDAVVDPALAVLGTSGLRVADASIMPDIVSVNTNAASTMIGWRAAEFLRGE